MNNLRDFYKFCEKKYRSFWGEYPGVVGDDERYGMCIIFEYEDSFLQDIYYVKRTIYTNYPNIKIILIIGKETGSWGIQTRGEGYFPDFDSAFIDAKITDETLAKKPIKIKSLKDKIYYQKKRK